MKEILILGGSVIIFFLLLNEKDEEPEKQPPKIEDFRIEEDKKLNALEKSSLAVGVSGLSILLAYGGYKIYEKNKDISYYRNMDYKLKNYSREKSLYNKAIKFMKGENEFVDEVKFFKSPTTDIVFN